MISLRIYQWLFIAISDQALTISESVASDANKLTAGGSAPIDL